jgi:hypothetical protein
MYLVLGKSNSPRLKTRLLVRLALLVLAVLDALHLADESKGKHIQVSKRRDGTSSDGLGLVSVD